MLWDKHIAVAEPLWVEADDSRLGRRFMVSRRAAGGNVAAAIGGSGRLDQDVVRSFIETLAQIHALPLDDAVAATKLGSWLGYPTLADNSRAEIASWRNQIWIDRAPASAGFTRLFDWLEANVPAEDAPPTVVHNDYGPHNILVDTHRISAVLDWEVPRVGDPAEDLSYFLQCCSAMVDRNSTVALYGELTGRPISEYRLSYFDVLSVAKVLMSTLSATAMYQATDPALIDWVQMPLAWHGLFLAQIEDKITAAEQARGL
jgi:aminoglycoside phosphotransferase (APT) family kinase protein